MEDIQKYNKTIRNMTETDWHALQPLVLKICFAIGIRKTLDVFEIKMIRDFLQDEFKNLTLEDIETAFRKWAAGVLDYKGGHYNSFDLYFIGHVLKSFTEYQKEQRRITYEKPEEKLNDVMFDPEKHYQLMLQTYKKINVIFGEVEKIYDHLRLTGGYDYESKKKALKEYFDQK